ncbi:hypothetical protein LTR15_001053 [Elasticomyces elasticus]|nr:hypothetical protein LTR15_001053 [Elasticomyces elasticus]
MADNDMLVCERPSNDFDFLLRLQLGGEAADRDITSLFRDHDVDTHPQSREASSLPYRAGFNSRASISTQSSTLAPSDSVHLHLRLSNEASFPAPSRHEEMETSAALHPAALPQNPYTNAAFGLTGPGSAMMDTPDFGFMLPLDQTLQQPTNDAQHVPSQTNGIGGFNEGDYYTANPEEHEHVSPTSTNAKMAANTLANLPLTFDTNETHDSLPFHVTGDLHIDGYKDPFLEQFDFSEAANGLDLDHDEDEHFEEGEGESMSAFAKLSFPDGDYYIKELQVTLGRNMDFFNTFTHQKRQERVMQEYAQEPSRPSQPDHDAHDPNGTNGTSGSNSLEGRPAPALPSHFSEQGGIASYAGPETEAAHPKRSKKKSKHNYLSHSSSTTTSVVPANLHATAPMDLYASSMLLDSAGHAFVPVHPTEAEDIKKISKEHLIIGYDFERESWTMHVLGSHVDHNGTLVQRGDVVDLEDLDRLAVYSLEFVFKLPSEEQREGTPGPSQGVFSDGLESEGARTSPIRRLSTAMEDVEDSEQEEEVVVEKKKIKITIGTKKKAVAKEGETVMEEVEEKPVKEKKGKKSNGKEKANDSNSPEAVKKPEKGKKPKAAAAGKEPADPTKASPEASKVKEEKKPKEPTPPPQPINLEGTGLEGLAPAELPQKRKGPGRPPKNGLVSKRDLSFVNRKKKEFEKRGMVPPAFDVMLDIVRQENKQRDAQLKAQQAGQAVPEGGMPAVVQSIEGGGEGAMAPPRLDGEGINGMPMGHDVSGSAVPMMDGRKQGSPRPRRPAKSPSPMKPESEYTEEELKKPAGTYVHQLDVILREIEKGDLQDIYDKMCKKWPYYKYRSGTVGWQSSVRHNLLQNERFREDGRSGKGRMWAIDWTVPLEKEKKRRVTPPPRAVGQGSGGPGQWGQMPGGVPYRGQPQTYGAYGQPGVPPPPQYANGQYAYPQYGANGAPGYPGGYPPNGGMQQPPGQYPQHGHPPQQQVQQRTPAPAPPPTQFQGIVDEIMSFRAEYLSRFPAESPALNEHSDLFSRCTTAISDKFHGTKVDVDMEGMGDDEKGVLGRLEAIFAKYEDLKRVDAAAKQNEAATSNGGAPSMATPPVQAQPPQMPMQQEPGTGNGGGQVPFAGPSMPPPPMPAPPVPATMGPPLVAQPGPQMSPTGFTQKQQQQPNYGAPAPAYQSPPQMQHTGSSAPAYQPAPQMQQTGLSPSFAAVGNPAGPPVAASPVTETQMVTGMKRSADDEGEDNDAKRHKESV